MAGLTNFAEDLLLTWMLTTASVTRPTSWFIALHTADPTETGGVAEVTTSMDSAYTRKSVSFAVPVADSGQVLSSNAVTWTVSGSSAGYTVTHISIWTASTSGNCLMKGALPVPRPLAANQVLTFSAGDIIAALN